MIRRKFLSSSLAASALAVAASQEGSSKQADAGTRNREYYELRSYHLVSGPQSKLCDTFFAEALIPALSRLGMKPIGVFELYLGPQTPTMYVLIPSTSLEALVTAELRLAEDEEYQKAGHAFLHAPATQPAYERMESSLMIAFEGHPNLTVPPATAQHGSRVFQLRTYESPSDADHVRKVKMFNSGEYAVFEKAGFWQVFYGDTLVGSRRPNLTYMLSFPDLSELNAKWKAFGSDPDWKKLSSSAEFSYEQIVSNITNLILNPRSYSQI
ncbi:MAG: NIPSNAP family protein [Acidobacteriaceae bacterium]|nr:NIPSNAP family protein [Acidobacteriaceae bacterium]